MQNRVLALAALYFLTCTPGFAQKANMHSDGDANSSNLPSPDFHGNPDFKEAPLNHPAIDGMLKPVAVKFHWTEPTLSLTNVRFNAKSLPEADKNSNLLGLDPHDLKYGKESLVSYKTNPNWVFGPGWGTNINDLERNPYAPGPTTAYVDLGTLHDAMHKLFKK